MRTLIAFFLFSFHSHVWAAAPSTSMSSSYIVEQGTTGLDLDNANSSSQTSTSFDFASGSYWKWGQTRFGLDRKKADYSRVTLIDRNGNAILLSDQFDAAEFSARAGVDIYFKQFSLTVDSSKSIGDTPFDGFSIASSLSYDYYPSGTKYKLNVNRSEQDNPVSFFVDPDSFESKERAIKIREDSIRLQIEQILAERWKTKIEASWIHRPFDRPDRPGLEFGLAWAFHDLAAIHARSGIANELRQDPLLDDRGYLNAYWTDIEFRYEPTYNWSLSAVLGTILETESPRGRFPEQKVGTDRFALKTNYQGKGWNIAVDTAFAFANTGYKSQSFGGQFQWDL